MAIEKGLLVVAGVALAGVVGYKVVKKKNPEVLKKARKVIDDTKKGASKILDGAKNSFHEGFASA